MISEWEKYLKTRQVCVVISSPSRATAVTEPAKGQRGRPDFANKPESELLHFSAVANMHVENKNPKT